MDALHSGINQEDGDYHPQVTVISPKCQQPCKQDDASSDNGEESCAILLDNTRDPRMPMSKQDCIIPTLRTLWSGAELYDTNGMKNCGMTEDAPASKDAPHTQ